MTAPTVDEIDRIARLGDPILRNLQITQCYYEISQSVARIHRRFRQLVYVCDMGLKASRTNHSPGRFDPNL
jgi:hypothetical protein